MRDGGAGRETPDEDEQGSWDDDHGWDDQGRDDQGDDLRGTTGAEPVDEDWEARAERERAARLRRIRRQRAVFVLVVLLVLAVGVAAAMVATGRWQPGAVQESAPPRVPECSAPAPAPLPAPAEVRLQVLNSTDRQGLAGGVATELTARGFTVTRVGNSGGAPLLEPAVLQYPPEADAAARAVAARVPGAILAPDPAAPEVALILGEGYQQLAAEDALVPLPAPAPGGCPALPPPGP